MFFIERIRILTDSENLKKCIQAKDTTSSLLTGRGEMAPHYIVTTLHCLYQVEWPFLTHGASAHRNFQFSKALKEKIKNFILTGLEIRVHVLQIVDFDVISVSVFWNRFRRIFNLYYFDRRVWLPHPWKNVNKYGCVQETWKGIVNEIEIKMWEVLRLKLQYSVFW